MVIFDPTSTKEEKDMLRQSFTTNNVMCCRMLNSRAVNMAGALDREIAPQNVNGR